MPIKHNYRIETAVTAQYKDGDMNYIEDDDGCVEVFKSFMDADRKLRTNGVDLNKIKFNHAVGVCRFCGSPLFVSDDDEYTYQCFNCDEDYYNFEQEDE